MKLNPKFFKSLANDLFIQGEQTSKQGLKILIRKGFKAIEQNPNKNSEGAVLARQGHKVVQFLDSNGKYVGRSVDGNITIY